MEITNIKKGLLSEIEVEKISVYFFVNSSNILMRKRCPPKVTASNEWCLRPFSHIIVDCAKYPCWKSIPPYHNV